MIAQMLALTYPQDVSAVIPSATPGTLAAAGREVARERAAEAERGGMRAVLEATLDRWFTEDFRKRGGDSAARERLLSDDPRGWAESWRAISGLDALPHLHKLRVPALCIAGEVDKPSPPAVVKAIADAIPGASFVVVPNAPHMVFIEQPQATARAIAEFLDKVPASKSR
jgi:3-oxoadipate enol-lactonase